MNIKNVFVSFLTISSSNQNQMKKSLWQRKNSFEMDFLCLFCHLVNWSRDMYKTHGSRIKRFSDVHTKDKGIFMMFLWSIQFEAHFRSIFWCDKENDDLNRRKHLTNWRNGIFVTISSHFLAILTTNYASEDWLSIF